MSVSRWVILPVVACVTGFGQAPQARVEFDVASVKTAPPIAAEQQVNVGVQVDGAQVHCSNCSLKECIQIAYRLKDYQVTGPDWLSERLQVDAKLPAGAKREQVPEMMQALLADRFGMKAHRETKELPVYAIAVAKGGLRIKESPPDPDADSAGAAAPVNVTGSGGRGGVSINLGGGSYYVFANNKFEAKKLTMAVLADSLTRYMDRPVVDMTGLTGKYDLTLQLTQQDYLGMLVRSAVGVGVSVSPEALRYMEGASDESLFSAMDALGLNLEPRKAPLELLVVDQVSKAPTAN